MNKTKTIKAVIFDLDGVLCHTDKYHYLAWKAIADELGISFTPEDNNRLRGVSRMESLEIILRGYNGSLSPSEKAELTERKNEIYKGLLSEISEKDLSPNVLQVLETLRSRGIKVAVGSSSKNTPYILNRLGLSDRFDAVSDGNNITRSKPDPEVFLYAAQFVDTAPEMCIVVEDAESGVQAAHNAGMSAIAIGDAAERGIAEYDISDLSEILNIVA